MDSFERAFGKIKFSCEDPGTPDNSTALIRKLNTTTWDKGIFMLQHRFRTDGNINEFRVSEACELHENWENACF